MLTYYINADILIFFSYSEVFFLISLVMFTLWSEHNNKRNRLLYEAGFNLFMSHMCCTYIQKEVAGKTGGKINERKETGKKHQKTHGKSSNIIKVGSKRKNEKNQ